MKLQLGGCGVYSAFAFFVVSLNSKTDSVFRNTYHSPASCFILFLLKKTKEISLYSFFKSCNYELSYLPTYLPACLPIKNAFSLQQQERFESRGYEEVNLMRPNVNG